MNEDEPADPVDRGVIDLGAIHAERRAIVDRARQHEDPEDESLSGIWYIAAVFALSLLYLWPHL